MSTFEMHAGAVPRVAVIDPPLKITRRRIDAMAAAAGAVVTVVLFVAGGLLSWGAGFARDYVKDELSSQHVVFPPAEALRAEGRTDLLAFAGRSVDSGKEAEAYAGYIDGHLQGIAGGKTYADLGTPERAAKAAVETATAQGADPARIAELKAEAAAITGQRDTLFKGETLRGLLLTAFAWSTVGEIAGYAAIAAFAAGAVMAVLVLLGLRHHHRMTAQRR